MELYRKYKVTKVASKHARISTSKKSVEELFGETIFFLSDNKTKYNEKKVNIYITLFIHHLFDKIVSIIDKINLINFVQTNNFDNIEYISIGVHRGLGGFNNVKLVSEISLEEIQQYLPEGHVDLIVKPVIEDTIPQKR